jgi:hypothetical protein
MEHQLGFRRENVTKNKFSDCDDDFRVRTCSIVPFAMNFTTPAAWPDILCIFCVAVIKLYVYNLQIKFCWICA